MQHAIQFTENITRREANDVDAPRFQPGSASPVMRHLVRMLVSLPVDLNGQSRPVTVEIENVGADRVLPAEA
ncbi:hypothetical protein GGR12_001431 [Brevundimonas lenta]|uniref:Uncharacterized protein n=1 Tax=Brevundimonas lenta TaxID=424796 RepID=A0A7W6NPW5_9CAUL|nr:hypothetical protein [Brevundimonas lenta]